MKHTRPIRTSNRVQGGDHAPSAPAAPSPGDQLGQTWTEPTLRGGRADPSPGRGCLADPCPLPPAAKRRGLGRAAPWSPAISARTTYPTLTYAAGGTYAKVSMGATNYPEDAPKSPRGECRRYTAKSRKRQLIKFNSINEDAMVEAGWGWQWITLTVPGDYPRDPKPHKRNLKAFEMRLRRLLGDDLKAMHWRLEFQQRGAPHWHLLMFTTRRITDAWARETWYEIVDSGHPYHLTYGAKVDDLETWKHAAVYAAKYSTKIDHQDVPAWWKGRFWGWWKDENLPIHLETVPLERREAVVIRRQMRRFLQSQRRAKGLKPLPFGSGGCHAFLKNHTVVRLLGWAVAHCATPGYPVIHAPEARRSRSPRPSEHQHLGPPPRLPRSPLRRSDQPDRGLPLPADPGRPRRACVEDAASS